MDNQDLSTDIELEPYVHPVKARTQELRELKRGGMFYRAADYSRPDEPINNRAARRRLLRWERKYG